MESRLFVSILKSQVEKNSLVTQMMLKKAYMNTQFEDYLVEVVKLLGKTTYDYFSGDEDGNAFDPQKLVEMHKNIVEGSVVSLSDAEADFIAEMETFVEAVELLGLGVSMTPDATGSMTFYNRETQDIEHRGLSTIIHAARSKAVYMAHHHAMPDYFGNAHLLRMCDHIETVYPKIRLTDSGIVQSLELVNQGIEAEFPLNKAVEAFLQISGALSLYRKEKGLSNAVVEQTSGDTVDPNGQ